MTEKQRESLINKSFEINKNKYIYRSLIKMEEVTSSGYYEYCDGTKINLNKIRNNEKTVLVYVIVDKLDEELLSSNWEKVCVYSSKYFEAEDIQIFENWENAVPPYYSELLNARKRA